MSYPSAPEKPLRIIQSLPDPSAMCKGCDFKGKGNGCYEHEKAIKAITGRFHGCVWPYRIWKVIK